VLSNPYPTFASSSRGRAAVARRAHNPKVSGSIPDLATKSSITEYLKGIVKNQAKNSAKNSANIATNVYTNARIRKGPGVWLFEWQNINPETKNLERVRRSFGLNRIYNLKQRDSVATYICATLNHLLSQGYNSFIHDYSEFKESVEQKQQQLFEAETKTDITEALGFALNIHSKRLRTKRSLGSYKSAANVFLADLSKNGGLMPVQAFTVKMAMEYIDRRLKAGISPNTMNTQKDFLSKLFEVLQKAKTIHENPFSGIDPAAEVEVKHHEALTVEELTLISENVPKWNLPYYVFLMHIFYAWMRPTHIGGLQAMQYDYKGELINITPETSKNRKSKSKQMLKPLKRGLISIGADQLDPKTFVFSHGFLPGQSRNMNITQRSNEIWNELVVKRLGINKTPYGLKHTGGQLYLKFNKADAGWLQRQMEHGSLKETNAYIESRETKILSEEDVKMPGF
jgi:integrase